MPERQTTQGRANDPDQARAAKKLMEAQHERLQSLRTFADYVSMPEVAQRVVDDPTHFGDIIELAVVDYGVRQTVLAGRLAMSSAAVSRWMAQQSLPVPYGRPHILKVLAEILSETADNQAALVAANEAHLPKGTVSAVLTG